MEMKLDIFIPNGGHTLTIRSKEDPTYVLLSKYIGQLIDQPHDGNAVSNEIEELDQNFAIDALCSTLYVRDSVTIFKEYLRDKLRLDSTLELVSMKTTRYNEG